MPGGVQGITPTTGVLVEDSEVYRPWSRLSNGNPKRDFFGGTMLADGLLAVLRERNASPVLYKPYRVQVFMNSITVAAVQHSMFGDMFLPKLKVTGAH